MSDSPYRHRYAVDFTVDGDIRFVGHNDVILMFARACVRSRLPVSFSEGFNPRARVSVPFPRLVGQASDVERLLVDLTKEVSPDEVCERLAAEMPTGVVLRSATALHRNDVSPPRWVEYRIDAPLPDAKTLGDRIASLLASESVEITRVRHKDRRARVVNIRPFVDTVRLSPPGLAVAVHVNETGSARPEEVCRALGMEADGIGHLIRRVKIKWQNEPGPPTPPP